MWKQLVLNLISERTFFPPVEGDFAAAERALGAELPAELKGLLLETNGIQGEYGLGLIWSLEEIVEINVGMREDPNLRCYQPFEPFLFFAGAGNGDQFAFAVEEGAVRRPDIWVWNHENDDRIWVAPSLAKYLEEWMRGEMKI